MTERVLGLDVSFWQDAAGTPQQINFKKAKENGANFIVIRASQDLTIDPDLEYNIINAKKEDLITGMYHFYDYRKSASIQAAHFAKLCLQYKPSFAVLDFEQHRDWPLPLWGSTLKGIKIFMDRFESLCDIPLLFYTNPSMLKYYFTYARIPQWLLEHDLWIAQYPGEVDIDTFVPSFSPWTTWRIWQFTDRLDGIAFGMESKQVDGNRFNGSLEDLKSWLKIGETPEEPEPPIPPDCPPCDCQCKDIDWAAFDKQMIELHVSLDNLYKLLGKEA